MWQRMKFELDGIFQKHNRIIHERRRSGRSAEFEAHLAFLDSFDKVQDEVIQPAMTDFGKYLEPMGHLHFVERARELIDGYQLPVSRLSLHLLLNINVDSVPCTSHSLTFKTDNMRNICLYKKAGGYCGPVSGLSTIARHSVGRYDLQSLTHDVIKQHLKDFVVDAVLSTPNPMQGAMEREAPHLKVQGLR